MIYCLTKYNLLDLLHITMLGHILLLMRLLFSYSYLTFYLN